MALGISITSPYTPYSFYLRGTIVFGLGIVGSVDTQGGMCIAPARVVGSGLGRPSYKCFRTARYTTPDSS